MGELISLAQRRRTHGQLAGGGTAFFFAVDCPMSYLAAERLERELGEVSWVPVLGDLLHTRRPSRAAVFAQARAEAASERLPLLTPDEDGGDAIAPTRAAVFAAGAGAGAAFGLAALRFAFCGGYDLREPEVLGAVADAAGLDSSEVIAAAGDTTLDADIGAVAAAIRRRGQTAAPLVRVGPRWFSGSAAPQAAACASAGRLRATDMGVLAQFRPVA